MTSSQAIFSSKLYDETTFYQQFRQDLLRSASEVVIESPYITQERAGRLYSIFEQLVHRGVRVYVVTRDPREHNETMEEQSEAEIRRYESLGVQVILCTGNHHRKLAILDRQILWEGSLNILSQAKSREIMRRIDNKEVATEMFTFLKFKNFL
jgi:phosphatidylserine/phosphatidylglycerophosphate/cardiolipin synthase-like enzyme